MRKNLHLCGKGQRTDCIISLIHGSGVRQEVRVTDMYTEDQSFLVSIYEFMFHISIIISEQLLQIFLKSSSKNIKYRTYQLASCRGCKNELAPVAEVT